MIDGGRRPWQVLMMRRPAGAEFAPDAYVFPGGSVQPEDERWSDPCRAAAIRETFEEVGILFARGPGGRLASERESRGVGEALTRGLEFFQALAEIGLQPAFDRLTLLTRWITPEPMHRRFDTRFYLARRPGRQGVRPAPGEVVDCVWLSVSEALAEGGPALVHATRRILETIDGAPDATALIARLRRLPEPAPIRPVLRPRPDGAGYDVFDDARPVFG
ncbi:MAG: NUDIX domain-containing protein [Candidatus Dormibacteraeota bacterium]|nr:NUDIX domain-containing protein [Candidatus Dormibacteraeota bacterium]